MVDHFVLLSMDVAGGISPPAYKETTPWGPIILVVALILFVVIFATVLVTKHLCSKSNERANAMKVSEETLTEEERALIDEYRKFNANQKDMLIKTVEAWNKSNGNE